MAGAASDGGGLDGNDAEATTEMGSDELEAAKRSSAARGSILG